MASSTTPHHAPPTARLLWKGVTLLAIAVATMALVWLFVGVSELNQHKKALGGDEPRQDVAQASVSHPAMSIARR